MAMIDDEFIRYLRTKFDVAWAQSQPVASRCNELLLAYVSESRWLSNVHVSHDLCPADGLCAQSLVLCERFKWEINIKRPFMAPSNKQLDSSFCFASLLCFASTGSARRVPLQESSGDFLERRFDGTCKSVRLLDFTRIVPHLDQTVRVSSREKKNWFFLFIKPDAYGRMCSDWVLSIVIIVICFLAGPGANESGSILDLKSKVTEFAIKSRQTSHLSRHFKVT